MTGGWLDAPAPVYCDPICELPHFTPADVGRRWQCGCGFTWRAMDAGWRPWNTTLDQLRAASPLPDVTEFGRGDRECGRSDGEWLWVGGVVVAFVAVLLLALAVSR